MTTKAKIDAAMAATKHLVDKDIHDAENMAPKFMRARVDQSVQEHRGEIDGYLRELFDVGFDAADKVPA